MIVVEASPRPVQGVGLKQRRQRISVEIEMTGGRRDELTWTKAWAQCTTVRERPDHYRQVHAKPEP